MSQSREESWTSTHPVDGAGSKASCLAASDICDFFPQVPLKCSLDRGMTRSSCADVSRSRIAFPTSGEAWL